MNALPCLAFVLFACARVMRAFAPCHSAFGLTGCARCCTLSCANNFDEMGESPAAPFACIMCVLMAVDAVFDTRRTLLERALSPTDCTFIAVDHSHRRAAHRSKISHLKIAAAAVEFLYLFPKRRRRWRRRRRTHFYLFLHWKPLYDSAKAIFYSRTVRRTL